MEKAMTEKKGAGVFMAIMGGIRRSLSLAMTD